MLILLSYDKILVLTHSLDLKAKRFCLNSQITFLLWVQLQSYINDLLFYLFVPQ